MLNISNLRSEHHGGVVVRAPTTLCAFETSLDISRILGILGILIISNLKDVKHSALNIWFPPHSLTIIHSYLGPDSGPSEDQSGLQGAGRASIFTSRLTSFAHLSPRPKVF